MADIRLTEGVDSYTQTQAEKEGDWNNYFFLGGDDVVKLYRGTVVAGAGNDRIERILLTSEPWHSIQIAYWDSPAGVRVDLVAGTADDGYGTRDTLVGVKDVSGSGHNDNIKGNAEDNYFWPQNGNDVVDGGAGYDVVSLPGFQPAPGENWRGAKISDVEVKVSVDGTTATVRLLKGTGFSYTLTHVEALAVWNGSFDDHYPLADFITQREMASDAIVAGDGLRWNAPAPAGTPVTLSYSFVAAAPATGPGAPGFRAFTAAEKQLVRDILAATAAVTQLAFTEVAEGGGTVGQLRFGVSQQGATKGLSWMPGQGGEQAGDIWMDADSMRQLAPGSEGYQALLHEIGHALGLRHPRNSDTSDAWAMELRPQDDRTALSVMSQTASGDGLFRSDWGPLDLLALRAMYGSRASHLGDTVYRLGALESGSETTVIDDGGDDTIDASGLTAGVNLNLQDGGLSSVGVSAAGFSGVDNFSLPLGSVIENAIGTPFDDVLLGNAQANRLTGGAGNDWIDGGAGTDTAVFAGRRSDYEVSNAFGKVYVKARDGSSGFDTLSAIERIQFDDQVLALSAATLAADALFSVDEDQPLSVTLPTPSDIARGAASYKLVANGSHGSATISAGGTLSYTPQKNYWGWDAVTFEVGGSGGSNRYLAYVNVLPVNDAPPVGKNGEYLAQSGAVLRARLPQATDVDGDTLTYSLVADSGTGRATVLADGSFIFETRAGQQGSDRFTYTVSDGMGGSNSYVATIELGTVAVLIGGTEAADNFGGGAGGDGYSMLGGNDRVSGGGGADMLDGGDGIDTALYAGVRSNYRVARSASHWSVEDSLGTDGSDRLVAMERLQFKDKSLALDLDGNAGVVAQVIRALLGPAALRVPLYAGYGLQAVDGGMGYGDLVALAISATPLAAASHRDFVSTVYRNVFGSAIDAGSLDLFAGLLEGGVFTKASLGVVAAQYPLNAQSVELVGLAANGLEYTLPPGG